MSEDWSDDPTAQVWLRYVAEVVKPAMMDSAMVLQIIPEDDLGDVKFAVELGMAIMMNKPILAVSFDDRPISPKLRMIADEVVEIPGGVSREASAIVAEAVKRMLAKFPDIGRDQEDDDDAD